jgi:ATP-dependent DNA ligase
MALVEYPPLYRITGKEGKEKIQIFTCGVKGDAVLRSTYHEGSEPSIKAPLYGKVKNEGRANERSPHETAVILAEHERSKMVHKGYSETKPVLNKTTVTKTKSKVKDKTPKVPARSMAPLESPMLLYKLVDYGLPESSLVQIKWNGTCGLYVRRTQKILSRERHEYPFFHHLVESLEALCDTLSNDLGVVNLEGIHFELDVIGITFQNKTKILRKQKTPHERSKDVIGRVFDFADGGNNRMPFLERYSALVDAFETNKYPSLHLSHAYEIDTNDAFIASFEDDLESFVGYVMNNYIPSIRCPTNDDSLDDFHDTLCRDYGIDVDFPKTITTAEEAYNILGSNVVGYRPREREEMKVDKTLLKEWLSGMDCLTAFQRYGLLHRWVTDVLHEEGTVVRSKTGKYYGNNYRSAEVLKHKDFQDEEAVVVSVEQSKGAHSGAAVCHVENELGVKYAASFGHEMGLSVEARKKIYSRRTKYIGRRVTIRFQDRFDSGAPQFGQIIAFRDSPLLA